MVEKVWPTSLEETLLPNPNDDRSAVDVYLVRHGQTIANVQGWMSGWSETELTDLGIQQALAAGDALASASVKRVISSDLSRARRTAELVSGKANGGTVALVPELREWHFGVFEGRPDHEMWGPVLAEMGIPASPSYLAKANFWENMRLIYSHDQDETNLMDAIAALDPSGEASTWSQYMERVHSAVRRIADGARAAAQDQGALVAVTHGAITRTLLPTMDPTGYDGQTIGNASISHLRYKEGSFEIQRVAVNPCEW